MANDADADPTVTFYEDGPLLLRGHFVLRTPQGEQITVDRQVVALCRCGKSGIKPFCDGTHKLIGFRAPSHAETGWAEPTAAPDNTAAAPENTTTT
ncbi:CDGSH iron-sulfur domain-containing protein [Micromonospora polyrhachis]|uniref:CDGSH-type Zn-finger protein n=1 Tax=Micromonospora polyrhachis TaxID=1282883 RepID=A0A7W7SQ04_9ACTN|nr:CDGSH iron-sulfur domain-containing protein [Micromonospora polyrhachis]MBB4958824.1 CDGSH-type Zn-finger protein [Micromonospora polyrhachis]